MNAGLSCRPSDAGLILSVNLLPCFSGIQGREMDSDKCTGNSKTNDLLAELNNVMTQSNLVHEIVDKTETLWNLEQKNGISNKTKELRNEIARLEELLRLIRQ